MNQSSRPETHVLGTLKNSYQNNPAYARDLLGFIGLFALTGLVALVIGLRQDDLRDSLLVIGGGLLLLAVAVWLYFAFRGRLNVSAAVYEEGLVFIDRHNRPVLCRWDDVTEVYETIIYSGRRMGRARWWVYTIHHRGGEPIKLDSAITHVRSLGLLIQQEVDKRLLPQAIESYKTGETVTFGPKIGLSRQGIVAGQKLLPWEQVAEIRFSQLENLQIRQKDRRGFWIIIIHAKIANYPTLKALIHRIAELNPSAAQPVIYDPGQKLSPQTPAADSSSGGIGNISARLGCDVRELLMDGYTMDDIQGVLRGEYDLHELRRRKPGRAAGKK